MTDDEITRLAQRALRCYIEAFQSCDTTKLSEGNFSSLMRRAAEYHIEQLSANTPSWGDDPDWTSYRLTERKLFSDLRAYIHEVSTPERQRVQLTAFDQEGRVCEFASIGGLSEATLATNRELMKHLSGQPWSDQMRLHLDRRIPHQRWSHLSMSSMMFKLEALVHGKTGLGYSPRASSADTMMATVALPRGYFETLSEPDASRLLDDVSAVLRSGARLAFDAIPMIAVHVVLIDSPDYTSPDGTHHSRMWVGGPPKNLWLADRLIAISD